MYPLYSAFGKSLCTWLRYVDLVQTFIDARGHHVQHLYKCTAIFRTHCIINFTISIISCNILTIRKIFAILTTDNKTTAGIAYTEI
jgi:hypothetical protein